MNEIPRPIRLRLSRSAGFNLQAASIAANGLPAVNVSRPSKWGNWAARRLVLRTGDQAVAAFNSWLEYEAPEGWKEHACSVLRGKNLACWCPPETPCHADILLAIANYSERIGSAKRPNFSCGSVE
jgi:hypothetical protein